MLNGCTWPSVLMKVVSARVSDSEYRRVKKEAESRGMNLSDFVRGVILSELKEPRSPLTQSNAPMNDSKMTEI